MSNAIVGEGLEITPDGLLDGYPEVDKRSCQLLGPTALVVQALMGILVILSLVYKRNRETSKRPWRIWLFDVSKQIVGQMFVHGVNLLISDQISQYISANACVSYFLNILIDTTIGVMLIYIILHLLSHVFSEKLGLKGFESGVYGTPPSMKYWARQASLYVLSLTTMKMLVVGFLILFPGVFKFGEWLLSWTWTGDGDALQVIFTMGIFPILMNIIQFWLIDSIVKASATSSVALDGSTPDSLDQPDREPLFASSSDDENDGPQFGRHDIESQRAMRDSRDSIDSRTKSHNKPYATSNSTPDEHKSNLTSPDQPYDSHSYPPSLSSSLTSSPSSNSEAKTHKEAKNLLKKTKRRPPPAPLSIRAVHQPAVNSPQASAVHNASQIQRIPKVKVGHQQEEWADSWDDQDDWANRVEEGDWAGERKAPSHSGLDSAWDSTPGVHAHV